MANKSTLSSIYKASFANRPRFDGGGYVDYSGGSSPQDDLSEISPSAQYMNDNSGGPSPADIAALTQGAGDIHTSPTSVTLPASESGQSTGSGIGGALSKALSAAGLGGGNTSNSAALTAALGLLSAAGTYKTNKAAGTLPTMPAMGAMPALPGSSTGGYGPSGGYGYQNYSGANAGLGYAPRAQSAAKPLPSYYTYGQGPEQQFFQQVGSGPIAPVTHRAGGRVKSFAIGGSTGQLGVNAGAQPPIVPPPPFMGGPQPGAQQPVTAGSPPPKQPPSMPPGPTQRPTAPPQPSVMAQRMAAARPQFGMQPRLGQSSPPLPVPSQGAAVAPQNLGFTPNQSQPMQPMTRMAAGGPSPQAGALSAVGQSRHVTGPGDGTSDSIPARLANGEYVIDAQAVSMLGNGDNSAGAKRLDEFRKNLRTHKGGALSKGKMAPDAKPIDHYMGGR